MARSQLPVLAKFIDDLRAIWAAEPDMKSRMEKARPVLEQLVLDPGLKAHSANWPSTEGRKNLLFYVDDDHGFAINAVVRVPGRRGGRMIMARPGCFMASSMGQRAWSAMTASMMEASQAMPKCR